jgi:hypothetical protein
MNYILVFLVILTLEPSSVFGENKFEKEVNFLVNHMSGEVVVCHDGNSDLVEFILKKINQQNQTGPIRLEDINRPNKNKCQECKWIVVVQKSENKVS